MPEDILNHCFVMEQFIEKFLYLRNQIAVPNSRAIVRKNSTGISNSRQVLRSVYITIEAGIGEG